MNVIYHYGTGNHEPVVYEGASAVGLTYTIRHKDGTKLLVHDSHLSFLNQTDMKNLPSTPLGYCKEVGKGILKDEAQCFARPRALTPLQRELMNCHHHLYHLPFHKIFMLAK